MRLVLTADTHGYTRSFSSWPEGDVLIVAGDLTSLGRMTEVIRELDALATLPYARKLIIAGNHDFLFERDPSLAQTLVRERGMIYLEDNLTEIESFSFYGTPWSPRFFNWAFMKERGQPLLERWNLIPARIDVLI